MKEEFSATLSMVRMFNLAGRIWRRAHLPYPSLDVEHLVAAARRQTGLVDFKEHPLQPALGELLDSLRSEAQLTLVGRIAAAGDIQHMLGNRLRLAEERRQHPEIADQKIRRPVFISGLPRTGSTFLHNLLALDPANRVPASWEVMFPVAAARKSASRPDVRIARAERRLAWMERLAPGFRRIHPVGAKLPQECIAINAHSFQSFQFHTTFFVPAYQAWLERQDPQFAFRFHHSFLQHLQWHSPGERWVLKAPTHLFTLEGLFAVYPDARIIQTHRDPLEVIASLASLTCFLRAAFSNRSDPHGTAAEETQRWARVLDHAARVREKLAGSSATFTDLYYKELVADPLLAIEKLYERLEFEFTPVARERMHTYLNQHPKDRHGRHRYSLEEFGLDADRERERYRAYCEHFAISSAQHS